MALLRRSNLLGEVILITGLEGVASDAGVSDIAPPMVLGSIETTLPRNFFTTPSKGGRVSSTAKAGTGLIISTTLDHLVFVSTA